MVLERQGSNVVSVKEPLPASKQELQHTASGSEAPPASRIHLPLRQIHVWRVPLNVPDREFSQLERTLSADERTRASRYCFEDLRRAFVAARGSLRIILARYVDVDPAALIFEYSAKGKPSLGDPKHGVHFNISHSGDLALVAVAADRAVGIDVERKRYIDDALGVARRFFSPSESEWLIAVSAEQRDHAFLTLWTRKEACLKVLGSGLSVDPAAVNVAAPPDVGVSGVTDEAANEFLRRIQVHDLHVQSGYLAAIAAQGKEWSVKVRTLSTRSEVS